MEMQQWVPLALLSSCKIFCIITSTKYYVGVYVSCLGYPAYKAHHYIVICGLSGCTIVFPHYVINGSIFEKKNFFNHKMSVLIFVTTFSETFLILRRIQRDIIINGIGFHVKYLLLLSRFNQIGISGQIYKKNPQIPNFMKVCPVGTELFQADRLTKLIVAFRDYICLKAMIFTPTCLSCISYLHCNGLSE
jgi:hypothetical protein